MYQTRQRPDDVSNLSEHVTTCTANEGSIERQFFDEKEELKKKILTEKLYPELPAIIYSWKALRNIQKSV